MLLALSQSLLQNELYGLVERDGQWVLSLFERGKHVVVRHVGAEAACAYDDGLGLEDAQVAGQLEKLQCFVEGDALHALLLGQLGEAGLLLIVGRTDLYDGSEASDFHEHGASALRVDAQLALAGLVLCTVVQGLFYGGFEVFVERLHHLCPLLLALGNAVEVLFYLGCEVIVHDGGEVLHQEVVDHEAHVGRHQLAFLAAHLLGALLLADLFALQREHQILALLALLVALDDVFALLDGADG